jgi:two-component system, NarL family, nitrate/nitrite response regulator NarL
MRDAPDKARLLLIDDHALFRESVRRLLEAECNVEVIGSCGLLEEARQILARKRVDLVLLDFDLGERDGFDFMDAAAGLGYHGKILLVTAGVEPRKAAELLSQGISGVVVKHNPPELLKQAIAEVLAGNTWFQKEYLQKMISTAAPPPESPKSRNLTDRENQVLSGVFDGLANKEIADRLNVSEASVKATMQQLFQKTGVRSRSQLVRVALERFKD